MSMRNVNEYAEGIERRFTEISVFVCLSLFAQRSMLFAGYQASSDDAIDLYAAFPVPSLNLSREYTPIKNYPSLVERIKNAEIAKITGNKI